MDHAHFQITIPLRNDLALLDNQVCLTPSALRTCLIHPDAHILVGILIIWKLTTAEDGTWPWNCCG